MKATFTTTVIQAEGKNATGLRVPADAVAALGTHKRPSVTVRLRGYTYRSTVAAYGDVFMLPLSAEHREAADVTAGDEVEVTIELDTAPRTVNVPSDLAAALAGHPGATDAFNALSYSARKEYVRQVESAKAEDTRTRRITTILAKLTQANTAG
jgi:antitoxin component of MazEF toxin-antitoxin module